MLVLSYLLDRDGLCVAVNDWSDQRASNVSSLSLGLEQCRPMSGDCVRSEAIPLSMFVVSDEVSYSHNGKIWEVVHISSHVRLRASIFLPMLLQARAAGAINFHRREKF